MKRELFIRYALLSTCLVGALAVAITKSTNGNATQPPVSCTEMVTWRFESTPFGPGVAVVTYPKGASNSKRLPVLFALHGQGESRKTPEKGALGWPVDYGMVRAFARLNDPPLTRDDFGGMIDDGRLAQLNQSLKRRTFRGIIVVSPYLPDRFRAKQLYAEAEAFGGYLINTILPKVHKELPALADTASTGIDGVSLGGRASVITGLLHPETFGAVGGIQAAFGIKQVPRAVALLQQARKKHPTLQFRLMSSLKDRFLTVTRQFSKALNRVGEVHQLDIANGNHSYEFNRGPGVYEMLLYYDRVLRGEKYL